MLLPTSQGLAAVGLALLVLQLGLLRLGVVAGTQALQPMAPRGFASILRLLLLL